jgi:two-component system, cell cycle response regulator
MAYKELFFGTYGHIFSYSCIILILILMFIITLQLFLSRRKKAYFSLTVSLVIVISQYLLLIIFEFRNSGNLGTVAYMGQLLHVFAFVLINMGIYQLFNTSHSREYGLVVTFLAIGMVIAGIRSFYVFTEENPTTEFVQFHDIWIELYLVVLTFLAYYIISKNIGQRWRYQAALSIFLVTQLARIVNRYLLDKEIAFLNLLQNFLPIAFYMIIFTLIFNRVVELLQAIYNSSIKDGLTGLYNRPFFFNRVADYMNRGVHISVIFCDIDNFKKLNDTKGHQMGDRALKHVASILLEESEKIGIAGRYGGEELVMLIADTSFRVEQVAEKIRRRVEQEVGVTVSIGHSKFKRGITPQELIEQADRAMYHSKRSGKNRSTGYSEAY